MHLTNPNKTYSIAKNAEAFINRDPEKLKLAVFVDFDLFFGITLVPLNFTVDFMATNTTKYFQKISTNIHIRRTQVFLKKSKKKIKIWRLAILII